MKCQGLSKAIAAVLIAAPLLASAAEPAYAPGYRVVDGRVDDATYRGWRAYHSACHACHGVDGTGTAVAPNLLERVKNLSPKQFTIKVLTSYRIVMGAGEVSADDETAILERFAEEALRANRGELLMPAWENDAGIKPRVMDLYTYLRARADGALGAGRPRRLTTLDKQDSGVKP